MPPCDLVSCGSRRGSSLTIDQIIRLKQAGVSDSTMEHLIKRDDDLRSAGTWKTKDGWIVHTTDARDPDRYFDDGYYWKYGNQYPLFVYPNVFVRRRQRRTMPGLYGWRLVKSLSLQCSFDGARHVHLSQLLAIFRRAVDILDHFDIAASFRRGLLNQR